MSAEEIDFDKPVFMVEIYHRSGVTKNGIRYPAGVFGRVVNASGADEAISKTYAQYEIEGLNPLHIERGCWTKLERPKDV